MNEIEETKASSKPTPQGTEDPDEQPGAQNGGAQENGDGRVGQAGGAAVGNEQTGGHDWYLRGRGPGAVRAARPAQERGRGVLGDV